MEVWGLWANPPPPPRGEKHPRHVSCMVTPANGNSVLEQEASMPAVQIPHRTRKPRNPASVPAERVRHILREISFMLHATRVVGPVGGVAPKKG